MMAVFGIIQIISAILSQGIKLSFSRQERSDIGAIGRPSLRSVSLKEPFNMTKIIFNLCKELF